MNKALQDNKTIQVNTELDHINSLVKLANQDLDKISINGISPVLYLYRNIKSHYMIGINQGKHRLEIIDEISKIGNCFTGRNNLEIALFIKEHQATTKPELIQTLDIPRATTNRIVNQLIKHGAIKQVGSVGSPYNGNSKKPVIIYGVHDCPPKAVNEAQKRYGETVKQILNKTPTINPDLVNQVYEAWKDQPETTQKNIIQILRAKNTPPQEIKDTTQAIIKKLTQNNVKVWTQ